MIPQVLLVLSVVLIGGGICLAVRQTRPVPEGLGVFSPIPYAISLGMWGIIVNLGLILAGCKC